METTDRRLLEPSFWIGDRRRGTDPIWPPWPVSGTAGKLEVDPTAT